MKELSVEDVQLLVGQLKAIFLKLEGNEDKTGLIDSVLRASNKLDKVVLDIDKSVNSIEEASEFVDNIPLALKSLHGELIDFLDKFNEIEGSIKEFRTAVSTESQDAIDRFTKDVNKTLEDTLREIKISNANVGKFRFGSLIWVVFGSLLLGLGLGLSTIFFFFHNDINMSNILAKSDIKVRVFENGIVLTTPNNRSKVNTRGNEKIIAVAAK